MSRQKIYWLVLLSFFPLIVNFFVVSFVLPEVVSLHIGFDGTTDRYGSKFETFGVGGGLTVLNLLLAVMFASVEKLKGKLDFYPSLETPACAAQKRPVLPRLSALAYLEL